MKKLLHLLLLLTVILAANTAAVFAESALPGKPVNQAKVKVLFNGKQIDSEKGVSLEEKGTFTVRSSAGKITKVNFYLLRGAEPVGTLKFTDKADLSNLDLSFLLDEAKPGDRVLAEVYIGENAQLVDIPLHG